MRWSQRLGYDVTSPNDPVCWRTKSKVKCCLRNHELEQNVVITSNSFASRVIIASLDKSLHQIHYVMSCKRCWTKFNDIQYRMISAEYCAMVVEISWLSVIYICVLRFILPKKSSETVLVSVGISGLD